MITRAVMVAVGSGSATAAPIVTIVRALDAVSGKLAWEYHSPKRGPFGHSGLLATEGGVLFGSSGGVLFALDSQTGAEMWRTTLGGTAVSAPISVHLEGHQTIIAIAGRVIFAFQL